MSAKTHFPIGLIKVALAAPLLALYGAWSMLKLAGVLVTRLRRIKRLSAATLTCPSCRRPNPLHGRWSCAVCSGVYHGFVGECPLCHADASMMFCDSCGVSIRLGEIR